MWRDYTLTSLIKHTPSYSVLAPCSSSPCGAIWVRVEANIMQSYTGRLTVDLVWEYPVFAQCLYIPRKKRIQSHPLILYRGGKESKVHSVTLQNQTLLLQTQLTWPARKRALHAHISAIKHRQQRPAATGTSSEV